MINGYTIKIASPHYVGPVLIKSEGIEFIKKQNGHLYIANGRDKGCLVLSFEVNRTVDKTWYGTEAKDIFKIKYTEEIPNERRL